jgi:hypothetical protein
MGFSDHRFLSVFPEPTPSMRGMAPYAQTFLALEKLVQAQNRP